MNEPFDPLDRIARLTHELAEANSMLERLKAFTAAVTPIRQAGLERSRWHHGNGVLCAGTLNIMRADFDTNPSAECQHAIFEQVCGTLNAVNDLLGPPANPFAGESFE